MTTVQIVQVSILSVLGLVCLLVIAFLLGSLWQLGQYMIEIRRELFDSKRDLDALEKMGVEHETHMKNLERLENEHREALRWFSQEAERREKERKNVTFRI